MGVLGVLATVVIALVFSQGRFIDPTSGMLEQAQVKKRFSAVAFFLGTTANILAMLFAVGHIGDQSSASDMPSRILMAFSVVAIGLSISFAAIQNPLRKHESDYLAAAELPLRKVRHESLQADHLVRWHSTNSTKVFPTPSWWQIIGALFVGLAMPVLVTVAFTLVTVLMYPDQDQVSVPASSTAALGVLLATIPATLMFATAGTYRKWIWLLPQRLGVVVLASGLALFIVLGIVWPDDSALIALLAVEFFLLLWPFAMWCYPNNRELRWLVIVTGWPIHVFRQYALHLGQQKRLREIRNGERAASRLAFLEVRKKPTLIQRLLGQPGKSYVPKVDG